MASTIIYNQNVIKTITEVGTITLPTNGKFMQSDVSILLDGSYNVKIRYNGSDILDASTGVHTLVCSGKLMNSDIELMVTEVTPSLSRTSYFYLDLPSSSLKKTIVFWQSGTNAVTIDWGDGSPIETSQANNDSSSKSHTYGEAGQYTLAMTVDSGQSWAPGSIISSFLNVSAGKSTTSPELIAVELGDGIYFAYEGNEFCGPNAFKNCTSLNSIEFPSGVKCLPPSICQNCTGLVSIIIPNSVEKIYGSAFSGCSSLGPNLELSTQTIEYQAFYNCDALRKIWIRNSVDYMTVSSSDDGNFGPFTACSDELTIYCEADSKPSGWAEYWSNRTGTDTPHNVVWGQKTRPW